MNKQTNKQLRDFIPTQLLYIFQAENEELKKLRRQQDEKLAELTRLKTLIQENGFPNIDQFLMLQQQVNVMTYCERDRPLHRSCNYGAKATRTVTT